MIGAPHATCRHCRRSLERRRRVDGLIYLDWDMDPDIDRSACPRPPSPDGLHHPATEATVVKQTTP
ncbi:hypothetical protein GCM10017559_61350 [Streptosporangium longisporum]|uniref:Uncharacterized protein n=1 Tax=Streptosporangium longisporum TaxID=46187 RepID=A0ABP6L3P7_9ACTN